MVAAFIILGIVTSILLVILIVWHFELNAVTQQLASISYMDSNELLHTIGYAVPKELINQMNDLLAKLRVNEVEYRQKNHALMQMMTNISHDLRTPLTSAMGYMSMIISSDMSENEKKREMRIVLERLKRLEELINSFFEFSKVISCDALPELVQVNLVEVLQESIAHYYDDFSGQNRQIEIDCTASKILCRSNYNILLRIFDNLIGNAYKHGRGTLTIKISKGEYFYIRFDNESVDGNINMEHIFDEFYTTDISRTKGSTGLGLAIAKQFTHMLGGNIYAENGNELFSVIVELPKISENTMS